MSRVKPLSLLLGVGVLLALSTSGSSDEFSSKDESTELDRPRQRSSYQRSSSSKVESTKNYQDLVQQLASPNKEATTRSGEWGFSVTFPRGYDVNAQIHVDSARQKLHDDFEKALPFLVEALDDERYCMTLGDGGGGYYNYPVGALCRRMIESHLEVYRRKIHFDGPTLWGKYTYTPISKEWFKTRKGRTLAELQIEAINWAIQRRRSESIEKNIDRRMNEIPDMQKLRDEIAKSGKPVLPRLSRMVTSDQSSNSP